MIEKSPKELEGWAAALADTDEEAAHALSKIEYTEEKPVRV